MKTEIFDFKTLVIAIVILLFSALMSVIQTNQITIGNYLWLPMGVKVLAYLIYGFKAFPGVLLGSLMSGILVYDFWNGNTFYGPLGSFAGALAPLLAIAFMRYFHLSNFFDQGRIQFTHVLLLILLSAIFNTLLKLFIYVGRVSDTTGAQIDVVGFVQSYFIGDALGGVFFVLIALKIFLPTLIKLKII